MAMKFDCSQIDGSCSHPVGEELVVEQEETRETEALGWNKIEEGENASRRVIWLIERGFHMLIHGYLLSHFRLTT